MEACLAEVDLLPAGRAGASPMPWDAADMGGWHDALAEHMQEGRNVPLTAPLAAAAEAASSGAFAGVAAATGTAAAILFTPLNTQRVHADVPVDGRPDLGARLAQAPGSLSGTVTLFQRGGADLGTFDMDSGGGLSWQGLLGGEAGQLDPKTGAVSLRPGMAETLADAGGAGAKLPPGGAGQVRSDGECDEDANLGPTDPKSRLPRNGTWQGEAGNSPFLSTDSVVNAVTGGKPINFVNGRPDFTPWATRSINFGPGILTGVNDVDFRLVHEALANGPDPSIRTVGDARRYMQRNGLTAHHATDTCMQLVPTTLNERVRHIGSAADLRFQGRMSWTPLSP